MILIINFGQKINLSKLNKIENKNLSFLNYFEFYFLYKKNLYF